MVNPTKYFWNHKEVSPIKLMISASVFLSIRNWKNATASQQQYWSYRETSSHAVECPVANLLGHFWAMDLPKVLPEVLWKGLELVHVHLQATHSWGKQGRGKHTSHEAKYIWTRLSDVFQRYSDFVVPASQKKFCIFVWIPSFCATRRWLSQVWVFHLNPSSLGAKRHNGVDIILIVAFRIPLLYKGSFWQPPPKNATMTCNFNQIRGFLLLLQNVFLFGVFN